MGSAVTSGQVFRFGLFEADVARNTLTRGGSRVKIQDQPFRVLIVLLERPGEIVTREELRQKLWPEGTFVDFEGSLNVTLKKLRAALNDDSDNPRFIETVPRRGYRFIAPVSLDAASGIAPAMAVPPTAPRVPVEEQTSAPASGAVPTGGAAPTRRYLAASLVVFCVAAGAWYFWHKTRSLANPLDISLQAKANIPLRKSVAVLGFHNLSGNKDDAWLSTALTEMLSTELAANTNLRIVSSEDVSRMKHEVPWTEAGSLARDTAAMIKKNVNADVLVLGSYTVLEQSANSKLRLDLRVQSSETGDMLAEFSESGQKNDLFEVAARSGEVLREKLGSAGSSSTYQPAVASLPSDVRALRLYSEGLNKLESFDVVGARDAFIQSVALEPSYPLGHAALADCWSLLGYEQKAKAEARKALDLSGNLPQTERQFTEARYREISKDWDRAIDLYRQLRQSFPDNLDYGLRLSDVLTESGKGKDALIAIAQLKQLRSPLGNDPRIPLAAAKADIWIGQMTDAVQAAQEAETGARARGMRLAEADALYREASASLNLGELDKPIIVATQAQKIYEDAGDLFGVAKALLVIGNAQFTQGNYGPATKTMLRAGEINRRIGNDFGRANDLDILGGIYGSEGDLANAEKTYETDLQIRLAMDNRPLTGTSLYQLAWIAGGRGDLAKASKLEDQALAINKEVSDTFAQASTLQLMADTRTAMGDLAGANNTATEAVQLAQQIGDNRLLIPALGSLGVVLQEQGDLAGAQQQFSEALSRSQKIGSKTYVALIEMLSAELAHEQEHFADAERLARSAIGEFETEGNRGYQLELCALLTRLMAEQNRMAEARTELSDALKLAGHVQELEPHINLDIAAADLQVATGNYDQARAAVARASEKSKKYGYGREELYSRLVGAQLETKENSRDARADLAALQKDANARHFQLVARKAALLLNSTGTVPPTR